MTTRPKKLELLGSSFATNNKADNPNTASTSSLGEADSPSLRFGNSSFVHGHHELSHDSTACYTPTYQALKNSTLVKHRRLSSDPADFYSPLNAVPEDSRIECNTGLLRKIKEDPRITALEEEVEITLDKRQRKREKQRAWLVQKTHRRLMETEKRKAIARRDVLKEKSKLQLVAVLEQN